MKPNVKSPAGMGHTIGSSDDGPYPGIQRALIEATTEALQQYEASCQAMNRLLALQAIPALKLAYRKHVLDDDTVGWQELEDVLTTALQECLGAAGFQVWLDEVGPR